MKKRIVSLLLMLVMLMMCVNPAFALEGWFKELAEREAPGVGEEVIDLIWLGWTANGELPIDDSILEQVIQQRFNVNITNLPVDNYNTEQMNLMYATATEFDINTLSTNFRSMADMEIIRPVDIEMLETYAPTIIGHLKDVLGDSWIDYCEYKGQYWGIPTITASWTTPQVMGLRTDWLEAVGYDKDNLPTTLEELEEMLLKLHTDDPDGNSEDDTYALGKSNGYGFYEYAYYGIAKAYWYYNEDGELMTAAADPKLKDVLKLINRWYELGIYDPEVLTDNRSQGVAKYVNDVIAGYQSLDNCFQVWGGTALSGPGAANASGKFCPVTIIPPVDGKSTVTYSIPATAAGITFGFNCSDEKLIRCLQIVDSFYSDLDLWLADNKGEKGVHWEFDEYGNTIELLARTETYSDVEYGVQRFYNFNFMPQSVLEWRLGGVGKEHSRYEIWKEVKDFPVIDAAPVSVFNTDAELEYSVSANKVYDEYVIKAIMGEVDIDETFDDYIAQWLAAGGQEILDAKRELAGK